MVWQDKEFARIQMTKTKTQVAPGIPSSELFEVMKLPFWPLISFEKHYMARAMIRTVRTK